MRTVLPLVAVLTLGCGSIIIMPDSSTGGSGGAPTSATSSSSASGDLDAGADGPNLDGSSEGGLGCVTCSEVMNPPHPLAGICVDSFGLLAAYVSCGCVSPCGAACAGSAWCAGMYPIIATWTDPTGACLTCLSTSGGSGCADQAATCLKN